MRAVVWLLVWVAALVAAGWYLRVRLRRAWRRAADLQREIDLAETRLSAARGPGPDPRATGSVATERPEPAVFAGSARALGERADARAALEHYRRARRAHRQPGWARRVDSDASASKGLDR